MNTIGGVWLLGIPIYFVIELVRIGWDNAVVLQDEEGEIRLSRASVDGVVYHKAWQSLIWPAMVVGNFLVGTALVLGLRYLQRGR